MLHLLIQSFEFAKAELQKEEHYYRRLSANFFLFLLQKSKSYSPGSMYTTNKSDFLLPYYKKTPQRFLKSSIITLGNAFSIGCFTTSANTTRF